MASKKKSTSSESPVAAPWSQVGKFLGTEWPSFVEKHSAGKKPWSRGASIGDAFASWGQPLPKDLTQLLKPLEEREPPRLAELTLGSDAPRTTPGNLMEQRIVAAQGYRPLWKELTGGFVEIGATSSGDLWLYAREPQRGKARAQIYLFNHETDGIETPQAEDLDALVFRAALVRAQALGEVDAETFQAARRKLDKCVGLLGFEETLAEVNPYVAKEEPAYKNDLRAGWLVTLLTEEGASDAELRGAFDVEMNPPLTEERLATSAERFKTYPPAAFYFCMASFFAGDEARLTQALELCRLSDAPLVKDLVALMEELRAGRKQLGVISDVQALRQRVMGLALWDAEARERARQKAAEEAEVKAASAAREGTLDALAWEAVKDPALGAAVQKAYAEDPSMAPTVTLLSTWKDEEGYRDEGVIQELIARGDRRATPLLIGRVRFAEGAEGIIALEVLAEWAEPRAVELVRDEAFAEDRFHLKRHPYIRLIQSLGDRANTKHLLALLRMLPPKDGDSERNRMLGALVFALGELGDPAVGDTLLRYLERKGDDKGKEAPISFSEAVRYALGAVGETRALAPLLASYEETPWKLSDSPATCFALGRLAGGADPASREKALGLLESNRFSKGFSIDLDKKKVPNTLARLFRDVGGLTVAASGQVMLEVSLAQLTEGARREEALANLRELVTGVLTRWEERSSNYWTGYEGYALLAWTLLALRAHPELGRELARPFVTSDVPLVRLLAKQVVGA
ncbi:HEAT repeat domain-containing protein [Corallococcus terminator]